MESRRIHLGKKNSIWGLRGLGFFGPIDYNLNQDLPHGKLGSSPNERAVK